MKCGKNAKVCWKKELSFLVETLDFDVVLQGNTFFGAFDLLRIT